MIIKMLVTFLRMLYRMHDIIKIFMFSLIKHLEKIEHLRFLKWIIVKTQSKYKNAIHKDVKTFIDHNYKILERDIKIKYVNTVMQLHTIMHQHNY